jgi:aldose sugar dehydrogenase
MTFKVILILVLAFFVLIQIFAIERPSNSNAYELLKQNQKYAFNAMASICGNQKLLNYTVNQELINFKLRAWENSTAAVNMKVYLEVYNSNGTLVAKSNETNIELVTRMGLPFEKRILIYLECANNSKSNIQFPAREDITIKKDGILFRTLDLSDYEGLSIRDPNLKAELVVQGLDFPTSMAFLGMNDILVLEKDKGTVKRIVNGQMLDKPLLDFNVSGFGEQGLVGIVVAKNAKEDKIPYVYLYFTESNGGDTVEQNKSLGNQLYRYEYIDGKLINPKHLLELPTNYRGIHNGGKMVVGPDNNIYVTVGDIGRGHWDVLTDFKTQNNKTGPEPDGTGGILRFTYDGAPVNQSILGDKYPLNLYYAYGIRNSYGLDFDPVTGNVWDTENGDYNGDEINLVKPGFNSGWSIIEGMSYLHQKFDANNLYDFNGKGKYSDPEFNWYAGNVNGTAVAPTALKFIKSDKYGKEYENDMLVADFDHGHIYHFDLNKNRTELSLSGPLADKLDDGNNDTLIINLGKFPGGITDLQLGPDGYIYLVTLSAVEGDCDREMSAGCLINGGMKGAIYRIVPKK